MVLLVVLLVALVAAVSVLVTALWQAAHDNRLEREAAVYIEGHRAGRSAERGEAR